MDFTASQAMAASIATLGLRISQGSILMSPITTAGLESKQMAVARPMMA